MADDGTIELAGGRLLGPAGPLPAGAIVTLQITATGMALLGGDPPTAWQIPFAALVEPRCRAKRDGVELAGWVAGNLLIISFPSAATTGVSPEEIDARLAAATGRSDQPSAAPRTKRHGSARQGYAARRAGRSSRPANCPEKGSTAM